MKNKIITLTCILLLLLTCANKKQESKNNNIIQNDNYNNWEEIFKNGIQMDFYFFKTGYAAAEPNARPYLNPDSFPENYDINKKEKSPIYSYCFKHPVKGDILIDAGLDKSFYKSTFGSLTPALINYQKKTNTTYKQEKDTNLAIWIKKFNLNPKITLLTHLHPDHLCGLLEIENNTDVFYGKKEDTFYYRIISKKFLKNKNKYTIDFSKGKSISPFSKAIDLFNDGSVWAISSPGHTKDHISYILNIKDNPVIIVGDLTVSEYHFINNIESSSDHGKKGYEKLRKSIKELKEFKKMYPKVKIYFSHDEENY